MCVYVCAARADADADVVSINSRAELCRSSASPSEASCLISVCLLSVSFETSSRSQVLNRAQATTKNKQQQQTGNVCADKINKTTKKQKKHLNGLINTQQQQQQQQRVEHFLCVVFGFASASSSSAPCLLLLAAHKVQVIKFCCYCYYLCLVCLSWCGSRRFA